MPLPQNRFLILGEGRERPPTLEVFHVPPHPPLCLLTVLSACLSPTGSPPTPAPTPSPTATPLPADVPLDLARVPMPAETTGRLLLSQIPGFEDASTLPAEDAPTAIVRGVYGLIPFATADGVLGFEFKGFTATAVPEQIARYNQEGKIETLTLDQQAEGDYWRYANKTSGVEQFIPKTVKRPDANPVYLAISRNLDDLGTVYFIAVDKQGNITRHAPAVLEKGEDGQVPALAWQTDGSKWQKRGHEALTADHVFDLKANQDKTLWGEFDPKLNASRLKQYAFTDEQGVVHSYPAEQIAWLPLLAEGQYQPGADGEEVFGLAMLLSADGRPEFVRAKGQTDWQAVEALEQETPHHSPVYAAKVQYNGEEVERMFILLAGKAAGVDEILDENGRDVAVAGKNWRYVFGEKGWVKELPENLMAVQERLAPGGFELVESLDGYYEIYGADGQKVEGVKVFEDGSTERVVQKGEEIIVLVSAVHSIELSQEGRLRWSGWEMVDGNWIVATMSAAEAIEGVKPNSDKPKPKRESRTRYGLPKARETG